jgi:hypothetical protein
MHIRVETGHALPVRQSFVQQSHRPIWSLVWNSASDTGDNANDAAQPARLPLSALARLDADRLLQRQEAILLALTLDHE